MVRRAPSLHALRARSFAPLPGRLLKRLKLVWLLKEGQADPRSTCNVGEAQTALGVACFEADVRDPTRPKL